MPRPLTPKRTLNPLTAIARNRRRKNALRTRIVFPGLEMLEDRIVLSNWSGPITTNTTFTNNQV
jgi:hypothetical protein